MKLDATLVRQWPKLAWVAIVSDDSCDADVLHGPCVEANPQWCAEAVWSGEYAQGDFDRTDRVFGTGVRVRRDGLVFVSSASIMDRLWVIRAERKLHVSNSLPAILAVTGRSLANGPIDSLMHTTWGSRRRTASAGLDKGEVVVHWLDNLVVRGGQLKVVPKPDTAPQFRRYEDYHRFLVESMQEIGKNLRAPTRAHRIEPLATVSSGYDSPAVALLSRHAGCERAITISDSNSMWRGSDSGTAIAKKLGLSCRSYRRTAASYPNEIAVWAASGKAGLLSWSRFEWPGPVCAAFLGSYCDTIWSRKRIPRDYTERSQSFLSMGEFRLWSGMLQCPVSFLGMHHAEEINAIASLPEMEPWSVGGSYDRPIPRRMLEEAGLARGSFAQRKKDTSHESPFRWPYSREASQSFRSYLLARGRRVPHMSSVAIIRVIATLEKLWGKNIARHLRLPRFGRFWRSYSNPELLFRWANEALANQYKAHLIDVQRASERGVLCPTGQSGDK
jgi:hypothetical protein